MLYCTVLYCIVLHYIVQCKIKTATSKQQNERGTFNIKFTKHTIMIRSAKTTPDLDNVQLGAEQQGLKSKCTLNKLGMYS